MTKKLINCSRPKVLWSLRLLLIFGLLLVPQFTHPQKASAGTATSASDDFNRADGSLGPDWTAISDGGMAISSQQVAGTARGTSGDMWAADTFTSDQFSSVEVTSTQLSGGQWVGPAVRMQNSGQDGYLGIYFWNYGTPVLMLYKRSGGSWAQLGGTYYLRAAGGRDAAGADGDRRQDLVLGQRGSAPFGHGHAASPAVRRA